MGVLPVSPGSVGLADDNQHYFQSCDGSAVESPNQTQTAGFLVLGR